MPKQVKDIKGVIKRIVSPVSKTFTAKKGKTAGQPFTIWSIGIQMDDGEWYNIKGKTEDKVNEYLRSQKLDRNYEEGDEVKIYLETEDAAGQYWRITSIVPWGPTDEVPVENVVDEGEEVAEEKEEEGEITEAEVKESDEKYHVEPVGSAKPEAPKEAQKEEKKDQQSPPPTKDMKKVNEYKVAEANKYELGMAKNNATILMAGMLTGKTVEEAKKFIKEGGIYYDNLITSLYNRGKTLRQKILGY